MSRRRIQDIKKQASFAVTGGIASGKTTVARIFESYGAKTIDFDLLCREVVEPDKPAWHEIVSSFGEEILNPDGTIDRKKMGDIVFHDIARRLTLERIVHPRAVDLFYERMDAFLNDDSQSVVQAVVPLIFETRLERLARSVVVVYCPQSVQLDRLTRRDGISRDRAMAIIRAQMPIEEKRDRADIVIDNSGSIERIHAEVERAWRLLNKCAGE